MASITQTIIGERGLTTHYPELGTEPIPIEPYFSETHFQGEKDRLFRRAWLKVGRVEQIPDPGSYFVCDLTVADT